MLEAEREILKKDIDIIDNFIDANNYGTNAYESWDRLKDRLSTIAQQSLSGSEAKASTPKCQSCGGDVKIESQETTYVCDKCFNHTYD